jgi:NAD(P)-dependent dehydrogenase (short-subunit alcohol dehydrogenase family)
VSAFSFTGKVALLTGAAGNLGRAAAAAFHEAGANVALVDLHLKRLRDMFPDADPRRLLLAADLLEEASVRQAVEAVLTTFGRIDILCNIAGGFVAGTDVHETPSSTWHTMFDLNAMSLVNVAKAVVPQMVGAGAGNIINVAAASSVRGPPGMAAYAVAKNGVVRITESMAAELRGHGIAVCCIMPTTIDTPQNRAAMPEADTAQWTPPEAIAEVMLFLASDAAMVISGCSIPVSGRARSFS